MAQQLDTPPLNSLPSSVLQALSQLDQPIKLVSSSGIAPTQKLHCSIMRSAAGPLCIILPGDQLLSLRLLAQHKGQDYQADQPLQQQLKQQLACYELPALPALFKMPVLLATDISQPDLYLESGLSGQLVHLTQPAWLSLTAQCNQAELCLPLATQAPLPHDLPSLANLSLRRIEQKLGKTLEIPPLPAAARQILRLKSQPDAHVDELTAIIETDPALSAQLLSWASSPMYGAGKIHSIEDAITRVLGFERVMDLALSLALGNASPLPAGYEGYIHQHWQQALRCASLIDGLVRFIPTAQRPEPGLAYLCGLLHNFGHLLLGQLFPHYFVLLRKHVQANPHLPAALIEQSLLGMSCTDICVTLLLKWNMPDELVSAIAWQQDNSYQGEHATYPRLLQLALALQSTQDIAWPSQQELCQQLHLQPEQAQSALQRILAAEQALRSFVS